MTTNREKLKKAIELYDAMKAAEIPAKPDCESASEAASDIGRDVLVRRKHSGVQRQLNQAKNAPKYKAGPDMGKMLSHAQLSEKLPWRTTEQHLECMYRAVKNGTLLGTFWYGDDNSIRRGHSGDVVTMLDDMLRAW